MTVDYVAPYVSSFTLEPYNTALVIVDLQYASASRTDGLGRNSIKQGTENLTKWRFDRIEQIVLPNVKKLLAFFRENKLRILYLTVGSLIEDYSDAPPHMKPFYQATNNYEGTREHEILDEIKPLKGECVLNKTTQGAFSSSGIDHLLRMWGAKYLILVGVSTNSCVESTAREAADRGYRCVLVDDGLSAANEQFHKATLNNWQRVCGRVNSTEEVIAELKQGLRK